MPLLDPCAAQLQDPTPASAGAFISEFVEIPDDVVFTVEYSVRAAQIAASELLGIERKIPPVTPADARFEALIWARKCFWLRRYKHNHRRH
jgi:myosin-crossreactive antigen